MTDEQLQEWQAATDAATPGPWEASMTWNGDEFYYVSVKGGRAVFDSYVSISFADAAFIAAAREAMPALLAEVEQQSARADDAEALAARRAKYNDALASERNELQMRLWKIDEQAKRIDELEAQLSDAETARDSWRDKHRTCRQVSDPAFADLTRLRKLLAEMENALPERERAIRRELHEWLYPPFEFAASGKAVTP